MLGGPTAISAIDGGQTQALASAVVRQIGWGLRAVSQEVERWRGRAERIPDATIRRDALSALEQARPNTDGAALFWTVTRQRCPALLRLLVAYEIMADFLDSMIERGAGAGVVNGRQLHLALVDAVDLERPLSDYLRYHPWQSDGGYLLALVQACRQGCAVLPSYGSVRPLLVRAAGLAQVQGLNHELNLPLREAILKSWAEREVHDETGIDWYEKVGAASAWLTVLALMTVAAEPMPATGRASNVYSAYFPWVSLAATLLDSYGDIGDDEANGENIYIAYYGSLDSAVLRIDEILKRAAIEIRLLKDGPRHAVILAAMVAMYLSKNSALTLEMRPQSQRLLRSAGPLAVLLGPVLRAWRTAYSLRGA